MRARKTFVFPTFGRASVAPVVLFRALARLFFGDMALSAFRAGTQAEDHQKCGRFGRGEVVMPLGVRRRMFLSKAMQERLDWEIGRRIGLT
jgi:hypothetical protein